mmetsp:Transcript_15206/g.57387  ORF Transcript_15206/g.57387 Transcript_15206/m.57387 type:complete len:247 (+) Transcript_15206:451-1191(+)
MARSNREGRSDGTQHQLPRTDNARREELAGRQAGRVGGTGVGWGLGSPTRASARVRGAPKAKAGGRALLRGEPQTRMTRAAAVAAAGARGGGGGGSRVGRRPLGGLRPSCPPPRRRPCRRSRPRPEHPPRGSPRLRGSWQQPQQRSSRPRGSPPWPRWGRRGLRLQRRGRPIPPWRPWRRPCPRLPRRPRQGRRHRRQRRCRNPCRRRPSWRPPPRRGGAGERGGCGRPAAARPLPRRCGPSRPCS